MSRRRTRKRRSATRPSARDTYNLARQSRLRALYESLYSPLVRAPVRRRTYTATLNLPRERRTTSEPVKIQQKYTTTIPRYSIRLRPEATICAKRASRRSALFASRKAGVGITHLSRARNPSRSYNRDVNSTLTCRKK